METSISISIHNICFSYKAVKALENISFQIEKGELFGLIGPDGAGKTTLFRILATLLIPESGTAAVEGFDTVKDYQAIRDICGYMPGRFSLYQDLTVRENLEFFASVFDTSVEENYDLIKDIYQQLEPFNKRKAGKLSGGMKQKLALCCALIHKPEILLLDEPTTGVDPISRTEFWNMIKKLKEKGITIMASTPYMDEALICERIAFMMDGKIMTIDRPQNLIRKFPYKIFEMKGNDNIELLKKLREDENIRTCYSFGQFIHAVVKAENFKEIMPKDIQIREIEPGIEDCFIEYMHKNNGNGN